MSTQPLAPADAPARLAEQSPDVRAAVLVDADGALVGSSEPDEAKARALAGLTVELFESADSAAGSPPIQIEAQVEGGAVFAARVERYAIAAVTGRLALGSLMLYDMRALLLRLEEES